MRLKKIVFIIALFLFSCGNKNDIPKGILKPAKMQRVLWDVLREDAFINDFIKKDSAKKPEAESVKLQQRIFAIHKVTKAEFYDSYKFYLSHTELLQPLLDSMIAKAEKNKYSETKGNQTTLPDSVIEKMK
jgi:ribosomal protein S8